MDASERDRVDRSNIISEASVLAAIPALGYVVAYQYERGFANVFGLPVALIQVQLPAVLAVAVTLVFVAVAVYLLVNIFLAFPIARGPIVTEIVPSVVTGLLIAALMVFAGVRWQYLIGPLTYIVLAPLFSLTFPIHTHRDVPGYRNKLLAAQQAAAPMYERMVISRVSRRFGMTPVVLTMLIVLLIWAAYVTGAANARNQRTFYTLTSEEVVLRIYGDLVIASPLDRSNSQVGPRYSVRSANDASPLSLTLERLGPLRPDTTASASRLFKGP